jgi:hypothetical protein
VLFEPRPIETARRGRLHSLAAVAIPVALLIGIVGVAIAGSADPAPSDRDVAAVASPSVPVVDGTLADAPGASATPAVATPVRFPSQAFDLATRSVPDTVDALQHGRLLMGEVVAIRGWISFQTDGRGCAPTFGPPHLTDDLCWSSGTLRDDASPAFRWVDGVAYATGALGIQLDPWIPPGVSRWGIDDIRVAPAADGSVNGLIEPVPVIAIGAFHWPRIGDCTVGPHCSPGLVIERIVWVDGTWRTRPVVQALEPVRAGLDATESRQVALDSYPGPTIVLSQTLVPSSMLDRLIPVVGDGPTVPSGIDRLWYLRVMLPAPAARSAMGAAGQPDAPGPARSISWIAIDDATGAILATQPSG